MSFNGENFQLFQKSFLLKLREEIEVEGDNSHEACRGEYRRLYFICTYKFYKMVHRYLKCVFLGFA